MLPTGVPNTSAPDIQVHLPSGTKTLCFIFAWSTIINGSTPIASPYMTALGDFNFLVFKTESNFRFAITRKADPECFFAKSYLIKSLDRRTLASGKLVFAQKPVAVIAEKIPMAMIEPRDGHYMIEVCLSNQEVTDALRPLRPTIADMIMERLYNDTEHHDVTFGFYHDEAATNHTLGMLHAMFARKIVVISAHKHVLRQWPYFRRMFGSEFAEGGEGEKQIQIRDVHPKTFQTLVRFMYAGYLPQDEQPKRVSDCNQASESETSWEAVFLAAHRYELEELCQAAQRHIVAKVTPDKAIPLLFRSGYLYKDLRAALVKLIANTSASVVAGKHFREQYRDHPEFGLLLHEIYQEGRQPHEGFYMEPAAVVPDVRANVVARTRVRR
ncbi:hypothetical protein CPC16_004107 [Podila verticillata]|nr:hypothetical protein CPC16_004107 [Podila verticillata]